jgi:hypothetical protein
MNQPLDSLPPEPERTRRPRTSGDVAALGPVRIALAILVGFLLLLGLWAIWPLIG